MPTPARCDALPESLRPSGRSCFQCQHCGRYFEKNATLPLRATRSSLSELRTCGLCFKTLAIQILALVALEYGVVSFRLVDFVFGCVLVGQLVERLFRTAADWLRGTLDFRDPVRREIKCGFI